MPLSEGEIVCVGHTEQSSGEYLQGAVIYFHPVYNRPLSLLMFHRCWKKTQAMLAVRAFLF